MITIKNTQKTIKINMGNIRTIIKKILHKLGYANFDIGIWFTTNKTILWYNTYYRKINKPTDILSFSYYPNIKPEQKIRVQKPEDKNLGDLIISAAYVNNDAHELGVPFDVHIKTILIHGICHLIGYTHDDEKNYKKMNIFEQKLARLIKN